MLARHLDKIHFRCNICGQHNEADASSIHREMLLCRNCTSCARFRGIAKAVIGHILKMNPTLAVLSECSSDSSITGIGMSDSDVYAKELSRLFHYTNTFYHTDPYLDIASKTSSLSYRGLDFVICSDVLEHVEGPVDFAIANIFDMLIPGGHLILTVPYVEGFSSIEHYPHYHTAKILEIDGSYALINKRIDGQIELHRNPCFHGGPGSVLEMRIFGEGELMSMLRYHGFEVIEVLEPRDEAIGYIWSDEVENVLTRNRRNKSYVLVCQRPTDRGDGR